MYEQGYLSLTYLSDAYCSTSGFCSKWLNPNSKVAVKPLTLGKD